MSERMSIAQYRAQQGKKRHKFGAKTVMGPDGERFDSRHEARRWAELKWREHAGEIRSLRRQVRMRLTDGHGKPYLMRSAGFPAGRRMSFVADATYEERTQDAQGSVKWVSVIEDDKGFDTPVAKLKRAIVERMTGIEVRVVFDTRQKGRKRTRRRPRRRR